MHSEHKGSSVSLTDVATAYLDPSKKDFLNALSISTASARTQALINKEFNFKKYYSDVETSIMIHLDHLDGVKSSLILDPTKKEYPTGIAYYRDATEAKPLKDRLNPDSITIESQNMLLRALNTMRGIDHVLDLRGANESRQKLLENFNLLIGSIMQGGELKKAHAIFNTSLIRILHHEGLDKGLKTAKEYSDLLIHYRDLASTIEPAKSLVTVVNEKRADHSGAELYEITHVEKSDPITEKTDKQKAQISVMKEVEIKESKEKNFHSAKKSAFQIADAAFSDLIQADDRRLPAQTRKTIGPTAKNAYLVTNKLSFKKLNSDSDSDDEELWAAKEAKIYTSTALRCGSLVYVGKGATEDQLMDYTHEIVTQLQNAAKKAGKPQLHFNMLITNHSAEHQDLMLKITKAVADEKKVDYTHAPTNAIGLTQQITVANAIQQAAKKVSKDFSTGRTPQKNQRILNAADIFVFASDVPNVMNVVFCASGQDRTGTVMETGEELWAVKRYTDMGIPVSRSDMESVRGLGCHNAFIASFASPGSPGMKNNSRAWHHFDNDVNVHFYRASADTNKSTPINAKAIEEILGTPLIEKSKKISEKDSVNEHDIKSVVATIKQMKSLYASTGKKHSADLINLETEANKIADSKDLPADKLKKIAHAAEKIWDHGVDKYKKQNKSGLPNTDYLINLVNRESDKHSTLRQVGDLLQTLKDTYPAPLRNIQISDTGLRIIPQITTIKAVSKEQFQLLQQQLSECEHLLKPKINKTLAEIVKNLSESKNSDVGFTNAATSLNKMWVEFANAGASWLSKDNTYLRSEKLLTKLNASVAPDDKYLTQRLVATLLQNINREFGDVLNPPISNLQQPFLFKSGAKSAPTLSVEEKKP